jgi:hypothetical protein
MQKAIQIRVTFSNYKKTIHDMKKMEIERKNENEYWIGENRTVLCCKNIIHVTTVGEQTEEIASLTKELHLKLFDLVEGKINFLIDVNRCGKNSHQARLAWNELSEKDKTNKVAVFGLNPVARLLASFVFGFSSKKNQRFFSTEEEARAWIAE